MQKQPLLLHRGNIPCMIGHPNDSLPMNQLFATVEILSSADMAAGMTSRARRPTTTTTAG